MTVVAYQGYPHFTGINWCAKCSRCGKVLVKFAFTSKEALSEAESARHFCGRNEP